MILNVIPPRRVETDERGVEERTIIAMAVTTTIDNNRCM
jgi:hypothetical protein